MLSTPTSNLNINNLSDIDKEKINEDISNEVIFQESYNDTEQLVGGRREREKDYIQIYNKIWPFRVLKITNLILLLILAVGSCFTTSYYIYWSKYWTTVLYEKSYNMEMNHTIGRIVLFIFAFCSLIAHHFVKKWA
ncbi:unnamed protein product [Meloidogyne enterolobii]|uniref:Uncharacterized protein n=1 Tax=Meloidogyne enterolobii TaxID=390850 RepID=A0ACB0XKS8_MELEN